MALSGGLLRGDFGGGLLGANQAFAQAMKAKRDSEMEQQDRLMRQQLQTRQMGLMDAQIAGQASEAEARRAKLEADARQAQFIANLQSPQMMASQAALAGGGGPTMANAARMPAVNPMQEFMFQGVKAGAIPLGDYMKTMQPKQLEFSKVDPEKFTQESLRAAAASGDYSQLVPVRKMEFVEGQAVNPYSVTPGTRIEPRFDPNKPFNMVGGQQVPNQPFQTYDTNRAKAGASNTSVRIDNKMSEGIASQVGPMIRETWTASNGAAQVADAANRIITALDTGKVMSGPLANQRLKVAQIADVLGVAGKDTQERIAATRNTIRGLAEMTLQGRKQMTGQGAITDREQAIAEKATSGSVEDLTASEIRQLAQASSRSARFVYDQHTEMLNRVSSNPATANIAGFYKPLPWPTSPRVSQPAAQPGGGSPAPGPGARFLGFEGQ